MSDNYPHTEGIDSQTAIDDRLQASSESKEVSLSVRVSAWVIHRERTAGTRSRWYTPTRGVCFTAGDDRFPADRRGNLRNTGSLDSPNTGVIPQ